MVPVDGIDVYDVDLFDVSAAQVTALQADGAKVVCYVSVGSWERWRPDVDQIDASAIGNDYDGWPGERWLDVRDPSVRRVMVERMDKCAAKGFDGLEPDNMAFIGNDTGFDLAPADQLAYARWLADQAHERGLAILQKNGPEMAAALVDTFDGVLSEDCQVHGECDPYAVYIAARKPVWMVEYTDTSVTLDTMCATARRLGYDAVRKRRDLDAWRDSC